MEKTFHIGRLVKSVFDRSGLSVSEFARRIYCERTNVYTIFNRSSIDVDLLVRISKALDYNFFEDIMNEYGLTTMFTPKLNIQVDLSKRSKEDSIAAIRSLLKEIEGRDNSVETVNCD